MHTGDIWSKLAPSHQPASMPGRLDPMLCTLIAAPFDDPAWIFEPKYAGLRVLACFNGRELTFLSRTSASQHVQFPNVVAALRAGVMRPSIVDGEVVCLDSTVGQGEVRGAAGIRRRRVYPSPAVAPGSWGAAAGLQQR